MQRPFLGFLRIFRVTVLQWEKCAEYCMSLLVRVMSHKMCLMLGEGRF